MKKTALLDTNQMLCMGLLVEGMEEKEVNLVDFLIIETS